MRHASVSLPGVAALVASAAVLLVPVTLEAQTAQPWMQSFAVDVKELTTVGENAYFILKPGYQLTLEGKESGKTVQLLVTVLPETRTIGGVETRIVEERESSGGVPIEVSRNFFAVHPRTHDVYYFGEEVDTYKNGKLSGHEGAWQHGQNNAHFGLMMPGTPGIGQRFYQELAPGIAMDRAEIVSLTEQASTPAGVFDRCLKSRETTPLEAFSHEFKLYAPGVGLIKGGSLMLVSHTYAPDEASLPAAVKQAVQANKPGAEIDKLEVEKESGITLYDIEFKAGQGEIEVAEDGTVMDVTTIIDMKDAPEAVVTTIRTVAKGRTIKQVEKSEVRSEIVKEGEKGRISKLASPKYVYEAELDKGEIEVASDGTLIKAGK